MNGTSVGLIGVAIWSITTTIFAFISDVPPLELIALVFFFGHLSMTAFQLVQGENILSYWRQPFSKYVFWLCSAGLYTVMIFIAFRTVPVFEANILNYLWPVLLMVFAAAINKESITIIKILGGLLGFAGVVTVFLPSGGVTLFGDFHWGHALSIVSAGVWALYSVFAKNVSYPAGFLGPAFLVFSIIALGLHFIFEPTIMPSNFEWFIIVLLGLGRTSYAMWDYGMKHGDVILLASVCYFLPLISSLLLCAAGFGPVRPMIAVGAVMIIISCIIVNYDDIKKLVRRWKNA